MLGISDELFEENRPVLFALAYRMLGSASDADDILQNAYMRVSQKRTTHIENPRGYLSTVVTRLCLNELGSARYQREQYLGPWLPEPLYTADFPAVVNPAEQATVHDSISMAFLLLLETLSPLERAAFLLHDVFDFRFREVGDILDRSDAACRQLVHRARKHIVAAQPRFKVSPEAHRQLLTSFIEVVTLGELDAFMHMLAADVTLVPDGGGERGAAIQVLKGIEAVAAFMKGSRRLAPGEIDYQVVTLNNEPAILAYLAATGIPYFALFMRAKDNSIDLIHVVAGKKLRYVTGQMNGKSGLFDQ